MPLTVFGGTLGVKRAAHLLRRAAFGANKDQIDAFAALTPTAAVNQLFRTALPDPPLPIDPVTGVDWINNAESEDADLGAMFKGWFIGQMLASGVSSNPLSYAAREKIVWFLHTHFPAIDEKIGNPRYLYYQNQLLRYYARDAAMAGTDINIKTLTKKISVDNAMLRLLDGFQNMSGNPNENYARELLELYTIGRGLEVQNYFGELPNSTPEDTDYIVYRESDVKAAAEVLTGWTDDDTFSTLDPDTGLPRGIVRGNPLNASAHETDPKTFSERFGNAVIDADPLLLNGSDPTEESALDEIDQLIEMIYAQDETSLNICRKIYRFFMTAGHDEAELTAIDSAAITTMATDLRNNGFQILPVIENLLSSQHFYDGPGGSFTDDGYGSLIKSPLDLVLGTINFFNIQIPEMTSDAPGFYEATGDILGKISGMGLHFYTPYDVAGYDAYHQYPMYHRNWITVNYMANRYDFIRDLLNTMPSETFHIDLRTFILNYFSGSASDAKTLLTTIIPYVLPVTDSLLFDDGDGTADDNSGLTSARLNYFLQEFVKSGNLDPEAYWTGLWNAGTNLDDINGLLGQLFNTIFQTPEYQLA